MNQKHQQQIPDSPGVTRDMNLVVDEGDHNKGGEIQASTNVQVALQVFFNGGCMSLTEEEGSHILAWCLATSYIVV
ncbi:hypothetical protein OIU84_028547 [Salix udensis]|uniref:Uncharacterized protein n=1 Tax=Salix udensis TaxID=889485 RepID=A0AAD6KCT6_9ROSI|nr:hypothetical protein OIU84_028547 [Salix udensis]